MLLAAVAALVVTPAFMSDTCQRTGTSGVVHFGREHPIGVTPRRTTTTHDARTSSARQVAQADFEQRVRETGLTPDQIEPQNAGKAAARAAGIASVWSETCGRAERVIVKVPDGARTRLDGVSAPGDD